jgi:uncharacterized protein YbjT (DUF2867 family)
VCVDIVGKDRCWQIVLENSASFVFRVLDVQDAGPDLAHRPYGGMRNVLATLGQRCVQIALMTAIDVTDRKGSHDWKRRSERLVRASGFLYTIVRPYWFDYKDPDQLRLVLLQGDKRQSGTPRDGVVA